MINVSELKYCPKFLGEPIYMMGVPSQAKHIRFECQSATEIYLKKEQTDEEKEFLRDFIIYYIYAPMFDNEYTDELREKITLDMSYKEVLGLALDYSLDPF